MSNTYNTIGIILKRRDYQENDRLFCILTKDFGKIDLLAKGTKKISSKLNSYMEPLYLIKIMAAKGKGFDKLANVDLINPYENLRNEETLFGFYAINYLSEVFDTLIHGKTETAEMFELLVNLFEVLDEKINDYDKQRLLMLVNAGILKFLDLHGYAPQIHRCISCHQGLVLPKNLFDFSQGGLVCENCKKVCLLEQCVEVSDQVIKLMKLIEEKELKQIIDFDFPIEILNEFNNLVFKLILINTEWPIKSLDSLRKYC